MSQLTSNVAALRSRTTATLAMTTSTITTTRATTFVDESIPDYDEDSLMRDDDYDDDLIDDDEDGDEDIDDDDDDLIDEDEDDDEDNHDGEDDHGDDHEHSEHCSHHEDEAAKKAKEEQALQNQSDMRKRIVSIQQDTQMSPAEKAKKIQELMTSQWTSKQRSSNSRASLATNKLEDKRDDFNYVSESDRAKAYHDRAAGILGCKHYQRGAKLQAHCCGKWYPCRFCHDEVSDHNIIRNLTTTMMCMYCSTVQPAGQDCINVECQRRVAKYYCKECKLWDDDPRKTIYHCHDCGICRIGKGLGQDYFHCKKCNVCMAISLKGRHKCIERNLESDCPICGEYMFTSTTTVIFMPCGHCIHYKCHQEYIQTSYQCPTCFKSLANMSEYFRRIDNMLSQHQMPPEYENACSYIYCNDCEKKCYAKFHFLYHKCIHCKGYNTKVLQTLETKEGEGFEVLNTRLLAASGVTTERKSITASENGNESSASVTSQQQQGEEVTSQEQDQSTVEHSQDEGQASTSNRPSDAGQYQSSSSLQSLIQQTATLPLSGSQMRQ